LQRPRVDIPRLVVLTFVIGSCQTPRALRLARTEPRPPNIILFVADDLGWSDVGSVATPKIDRLFREGVELDRSRSHSSWTSRLKFAALWV